MCRNHKLYHYSTQRWRYFSAWSALVSERVRESWVPSLEGDVSERWQLFAASAAAPLKSQKWERQCWKLHSTTNVPQTQQVNLQCAAVRTHADLQDEGNLIYLCFNWGFIFKLCWIIHTQMLEDSLFFDRNRMKTDIGTRIVWKVNFWGGLFSSQCFPLHCCHRWWVLSLA